MSAFIPLRPYPLPHRPDQAGGTGRQGAPPAHRPHPRHRSDRRGAGQRPDLIGDGLERLPVTAASTTAFGASFATASEIVSIGVSLPRRAMRQPRSRARGRTRSDRVMLLAGRTGEQRKRSAPGAPVAAQGQHSPAQEGGRECSSATETSPLSQRVPIAFRTGNSTRLTTASTVKRAIASSRIAFASASSKRSRAAASRSAWSLPPRPARARGRRYRRGRQPRRLGGRDARVDQRLHRSYALLVARPVEAKAARAALRPQQAIPPLPCPQRVHANAGSPAELADADERPLLRCGGWDRHWTDP